MRPEVILAPPRERGAAIHVHTTEKSLKNAGSSIAQNLLTNISFDFNSLPNIFGCAGSSQYSLLDYITHTIVLFFSHNYPPVVDI